MTRTTKTFERGEVVEVQREVAGAWEACSYLQHSALRGHHVVKLMPGAARNIIYNGKEGIECDALCVPSRRIRKRSVR